MYNIKCCKLWESYLRNLCCVYPDCYKFGAIVLYMRVIDAHKFSCYILLQQQPYRERELIILIFVVFMQNISYDLTENNKKTHVIRAGI